MRVQWATTEKAMMASDKHFDSKYTKSEMTTIASFLIKRAEYVGKSDRCNGKYDPAKIIWSVFNGTTYAIVIDSKDIKKGIATIISFYDVNESTKEHKAKRFGMKKVR